MLITQVLATAFVIVGCCITMYVCIYNCYCIVRGIDVDEVILAPVIVIGVMTMLVLLVLCLLSLLFNLISHLTS